MNDKNGGWFSGLIISAGFVSMILAPFYIGYRYGLHVLVGICAVLATIYALFSPELVAMAKEIGDCGYGCLAAPGVQMILALDRIGWWWMAGFMWAGFILSLVAHAIRTDPDSNA